MLNLQKKDPIQAPCAQVMSPGQEFQFPPIRVYELGNRTKRVTNHSLRVASLMRKEIVTKDQLHRAPITPSTSKHTD